MYTTYLYVVTSYVDVLGRYPYTYLGMLVPIYQHGYVLTVAVHTCTGCWPPGTQEVAGHVVTQQSCT
jgi:hypothetical protein